MVKDLIRFYLTGEAFLELTDISGTNLINVRDCKYDDELLAWWDLMNCGQIAPHQTLNRMLRKNH
ncbi:putative L-xylulose kinase [Klebsiella pneumoniae]|uniref:Putative L-xylulose kinase n=1 Tax=Klebsiella pneumoniae TaxID=573 RepID=A0A377WD07_KLEPN|nr:putative L-xylulose kinase [Klebsiella pneumoniae]